MRFLCKFFWPHAIQFHNKQVFFNPKNCVARTLLYYKTELKKLRLWKNPNFLMRIQILQLTHSALKLPLALCFSYKRKTQAVSKLLLLLFLSCRGRISSISLTYLTCCDLTEYFVLFFLILHSFTYFFWWFSTKKNLEEFVMEFIVHR